MGLFFLEQKETLLQISPVPHRSDFFNFLFQIVKWGNFAETLVYNTLCFTFASPEIQKNRVRPHCAMTPLGTSEVLKQACNRPIPDARCHGTHCIKSKSEINLSTSYVTKIKLLYVIFYMNTDKDRSAGLFWSKNI